MHHQRVIFFADFETKYHLFTFNLKYVLSPAVNSVTKFTVQTASSVNWSSSDNALERNYAKQMQVVSSVARGQRP